MTHINRPIVSNVLLNVYFSFILCLCFFPLTGSCSPTPDSSLRVAPAPLPQSGEFIYIATRGEKGINIKLGEARYSWQRDKDKYTMTLKLKTMGLADAIYHFEYTQESIGRVAGNALIPEVFQVSQNGRGDEIATFDWNAKKVTLNRKGNKTKFKIKKDTQDILSIWQSAALSGPDALIGDRVIVTNRGVYSANVILANTEKQELPIGNVFTQHLLILSKGANKLHLDFWLAPSYYNLPARILMTDQHGNKVDLQLKAIRNIPGNAPKSDPPAKSVV